MKAGGRSGNPTGSMEKDRAPLGRLIIRKKGDGTSSGGPSGKQKVFESKKEKKRPRLILSDSESDKDLLISPRRMVTSRNSNASVVVKKNSRNSFKHKEEIEINRKRIRSEPGKWGEDAKSCRSSFVEAGIESKRSRLDVFEYNEDDGIDRKRMKKERLDDDGAGIGRSKVLGSNSLAPSGNQRELEIECSRSVSVDKRKHSNFGRNSSMLVERNRGADLSDKKRFEIKKDASFRPVGTLREKFGVPCDEPIRVQGKNGVLKVMLNNKNRVGGSEKTYGRHDAEDNRKGSMSANTSNWNAPLRPPFLSEKKFCEKPCSFATMEKNQVKSRKISSSKNIKARDWRTEDSDMSSPLGSKNVSTYSFKKEVRNKGERTLTSKLSLSTRRKKGEVRRGSGTEKQLLREQIREMLVNAGWTIDFRPRRNRNYHDAVYINPSGTEHWSILKAYDALQKQCEDEDSDHKRSGTSSSFTPIPEKVLSQLTRQTRKKIEREMMMKHRADRGNKNAKESTEKKSAKSKHVKEKLNSLIMRDGKSLKVRMKENSFAGLNTKSLTKSQKSTHLSNKAGSGNGECLLHKQSSSTGTLHKGMPKPARVQKSFFASDARLLQRRKHKKQSGCALLVRSSSKGVNPDDGDFIPYTGKRTVLSWLIDLGIVPLSGKVQYMNKRRTRVMLEGWITRDGIHCGCCSKILTISKFEIHAGSKLRQPFQNIYLETGVSLFQCQLDAWNGQEESERSEFHFIDFDGDDPNDDTCGICGDGGDLICCDGCPSTFHQSCLGIQMLPLGDWHCPNCSCKFCGIAGASTDQGESITLSPLLTCSLCEKKYHQLCSQATDAVNFDSNSLHTYFCGRSCRELFEQLQKLLGVKHELEAGFSWTLVQRSDLDSDTHLLGLPQKAECNSKLAVALSVMDECFLPIVDRRSGINLIHNVVYNCGSNFNRLNYSGFYTFVLERGDELISAASIRIHGTRLAEMPFIGTRHIYRRQGMCRRLLNAIESVLCSLNVEKLIIPAISELMHTWTIVFNFKLLEESHKHEMRSMNMLVFPGTDLLQKLLVKHNLTEGNVPDGSVVKATELKSNHQIMPEVIKKSDIGSSAGPDVHSSYEGVVPHACEVNDEVAAIETGSQPPGGSIYDTSDVIDAHEVNVKVAGVEMDVHSSAETSVQQTTNTIGEYPNTVSGYNFQATDGSPVQCNTDLNHQNMHEMECKSVEACHVVSDAIHCKETILCASGEATGHDVCEVRTEEVADEPDVFTSDEGCVHHSADIITQVQDAAFVVGFQGSGENVVSHDSESISQPRGTVSEYNFHFSAESVIYHDFKLPQKIQECALDASDTVCNTHEVKNEVAAVEYNPQALGEDSVVCTSEVVSEPLYTASKCHYLASAECNSFESLSNCCNSSSDIAVLPAYEVVHLSTHDVADNCCVDITVDSGLNASDRGSMLGTCGVEVGVGPNHHTFGQASLHDTLDSVPEPNFLASGGSNRFCNSEMLQKNPDFTSDLVQNVFASAEGNAHDNHSLKDEVPGVEPIVHALDEDSMHNTSEMIIKSLDTTQSDSQVAHLCHPV